MKILIIDKSRTTSSFLQDILEDYSDEIKEEWDICCQSDMEKAAGNVEDMFYDLILCSVECVSEDAGQNLWRQLRLRGADIIYIVPEGYPIAQLKKTYPFTYIEAPVRVEDIREVICDYYRMKAGGQEFLSFKRRNGFHQYKISEIFYIESDGRKLKVVADKREGTYYGSIKALEEQLQHKHFLICHNSFLINYDNVVEVRRDSFVFPGERIVPVSQKRHAAVMQQIQEWEKRKQ